MAIQMISYDLYKPGQNYKDLTAKVTKTFPNHCKVLRSLWLVVTDLSATEIFELLEPILDSNDKMLINELTEDRSGSLEENHTDWVEENS